MYVPDHVVVRVTFLAVLKLIVYVSVSHITDTGLFTDLDNCVNLAVVDTHCGNDEGFVVPSTSISEEPSFHVADPNTKSRVFTEAVFSLR
jgi:hypothetical protein